MTSADSPADKDAGRAEAQILLIDDTLPQTQCRQCGYDGCRPYAEAMVRRGESINKCPPGGQATVRELARLLGRAETLLEPTPGSGATPLTAVIREAECIGCTKCIQACPIDAILGAARLMHSVIESECTGCELCIEPCPVDCIDLVRIPDVTALADAPLRQHRRRRYENRRARLAGEVRAHSASRRSVTTPLASDQNAVPGQPFSRQRAREEIARAVERVRKRRQAKDKPS